MLLAGRVFESYQEGKIDFKPTYRYIAGTDVYDNRPEGKVRCPAWCDRVLWRLQRPLYYPIEKTLSSSSVDGGDSDGGGGGGMMGIQSGEDGIQWARRISALTEANPEKGVAEKVSNSYLEYMYGIHTDGLYI